MLCCVILQKIIFEKKRLLNDKVKDDGLVRVGKGYEYRFLKNKPTGAMKSGSVAAICTIIQLVSDAYKYTTIRLLVYEHVSEKG